MHLWFISNMATIYIALSTASRYTQDCDMCLSSLALPVLWFCYSWLITLVWLYVHTLGCWQGTLLGTSVTSVEHEAHCKAGLLMDTDKGHTYISVMHMKWFLTCSVIQSHRFYIPTPSSLFLSLSYAQDWASVWRHRADRAGQSKAALFHRPWWSYVPLHSQLSQDFQATRPRWL